MKLTAHRAPSRIRRALRPRLYFHTRNFKFGKFELNNLISEKRMLFLSGQGGFYQVYHFETFEENQAALAGTNPLNPGFGVGDNQLGIELMGHSENSYTRYSVAMLSSNDGNVDIPNRTYDTYVTFDQAFPLGRLGIQRVGAFAYYGLRPTYGYTSDGMLIPGEGLGNKAFYRMGFTGDWYLGKFDFSTVFMHGWDNAYLGTVTPGNAPLPAGAQAPTWNGGFIETHYVVKAGRPGFRDAVVVSGIRVVTLLYELQRRNLKRGIAALCLGGGNAVALAVERP